MSSQKGNVQRKRKPKYQNAFAFKNTMHDTSGKNKQLNMQEYPSLCSRCVEKIKWKIKYKKYKPLTQARKCVNCDQKTVKQAYYIMCLPCATSKEVCAKCLAKLDAQADLSDSDLKDASANTLGEGEAGTSDPATLAQDFSSEDEGSEEEDQGTHDSANEGSDVEAAKAASDGETTQTLHGVQDEKHSFAAV